MNQPGESGVATAEPPETSGHLPDRGRQRMHRAQPNTSAHRSLEIPRWRWGNGKMYTVYSMYYMYICIIYIYMYYIYIHIIYMWICVCSVCIYIYMVPHHLRIWNIWNWNFPEAYQELNLKTDTQNTVDLKLVSYMLLKFWPLSI